MVFYDLGLLRRRRVIHLAFKAAMSNLSGKLKRKTLLNGCESVSNFSVEIFTTLFQRDTTPIESGTNFNRRNQFR